MVDHFKAAMESSQSDEPSEALPVIAPASKAEQDDIAAVLTANPSPCNAATLTTLTVLVLSNVLASLRIRLSFLNSVSVTCKLFMSLI
jgi:hypothetical protein